MVRIEKRHLAAHLSAPPGWGRGDLSGIHFTNTEAISVDGFRMLITPLPAPDNDSDQLPEDGITVPIATCLRAASAVPRDQLTGTGRKRTRVKPSISLRSEDARFSISITDADGSFVIGGQPVVGKFPSYEKALPQPPYAIRIGVGADYLIKTLQQLRKADPDGTDQAIVLNISASDKPILIEALTGGAKAVLMPRHIFTPPVPRPKFVQADRIAVEV